MESKVDQGINLPEISEDQGKSARMQRWERLRTMLTLLSLITLFKPELEITDVQNKDTDGKTH